MDKAGEDLLIGRRVAGKYEVLSVLGQGAMGIVYEARQVALDKIVALKVLAHRLRDDPEFVSRFHTEARAASRLDHPNSTRVLDFGEEPDGLLYIAMELLSGRTLQRVLEEEWPLPAGRVASLMSQTLSGVGAAHALGIVHRDLKPENIVILEGRDEEDAPVEVVKVCDFGIAKLAGASEPQGSSRNAVTTKRATRAGVIVGTPQYMSPEQARGEELDERSDLYSLGVVLFEVLTGMPPFDQASAAEVIYRHGHVEPPRPSTLRPDVDPRLEAICLRAMTKDKTQRYATAREMRAELRGLVSSANGHEGSPVEPSSAARERKPGVSAPTLQATVSSPPAPRKRGLLRRGAVLALAATLLAGVGWWSAAKVRARASAVQAMSAPSSPPSSPRLPAAATTANVPVSAGSVATTSRTEAAPPKRASATESRATYYARARLPHGVTVNAAGAESDETPPPPPHVLVAPSETAAPPAPPAPATTSASIRARSDPSRARVAIGRIQPERVTAASVDATLRHLDFTGCYRAALAQSESPLEGAATLAIETDEDGTIVRASLTGGDFPARLRQCVAMRANGARVHDVDTGAAAAKVTLRFSLQ